MFTVLKFTLALSLVTSAALAEGALTQIQSANFDFDDNLFITSAPVMIYDKVHHREKKITSGYWPLVNHLLGKPGAFKNFEARPSTYRNFADSPPEGKEKFPKEIAEALEKNPDGWRGPSWNAFDAAMSRPSLKKYTTIITARKHSPQAILAGLEVMKDRGVMPAVLSVENIYPVASPQFSKELKGKTTAESKANVMKRLLDNIEAQTIPDDAMAITDREGTGKAKLDLWSFSDDDYENFSKAQEALSHEVAKGKWPHIKIILYYTGLNNPEEPAHGIVLKPDGTNRAILPDEEMLGENLSKQLTKTQAEAALAKLGEDINK